MSLCREVTIAIAPAKLALSHDDITKGWTLRMLTAASSLYRRGDRAPITVDGYRRYELARKRSRRAARIYARPQPVDLDEVMYLLGAGETLEATARRLGVQEEAILTAGRRKGSEAQRARLARAADELREIRLGLARAS